MPTNRDKFRAAYLVNLQDDVRRHPDEYDYVADAAPTVVGRMMVALADGTGNINSRAIRRTCRELGVRCTAASIQAHLRKGTAAPL